MNEISSYQFVKCHEIPVYTCYDVFKTLASVDSYHSYEAYITHPHVKYDVVLGDGNYEYTHPTSSFSDFFGYYAPSALWNNYSIRDLCDIMYELTEETASKYHRYVYLSSYTPQEEYKFNSLPVGDAFIMDLYKKNNKSTYTSFYCGLASSLVTSSMLYGIEGLKLCPYLDTGQFSWAFNQGRLTISGSHRARSKKRRLLHSTFFTA